MVSCWREQKTWLQKCSYLDHQWVSCILAAYVQALSSAPPLTTLGETDHPGIAAPSNFSVIQQISFDRNRWYEITIAYCTYLLWKLIKLIDRTVHGASHSSFTISSPDCRLHSAIYHVSVVYLVWNCITHMMHDVMSWVYEHAQLL